MGNMTQFVAELLGTDSSDKAAARQILGAAEKYCAHADGTADAMTASFEPPIKQAVHNLTVLVRAKTPNTTGDPTFKADETNAIPIVKDNNRPLLAGDIAGEGHWLELRYDDIVKKWALRVIRQVASRVFQLETGCEWRWMKSSVNWPKYAPSRCALQITFP